MQKMVRLKIIGFLIILPYSMALSTVPPPIPSVQDTIYSGKLTVTLFCPDTSATIYYTTDGSIPGITGPFSPAGWNFEFDSTVTLKAIAMYKKGPGEFDSSSMITVKYLKKLGMPFIDPNSRPYKDSIIIRLRPPERDATIHYTLDGTDPDIKSTVYTKRLVFKETTTIKYMAEKYNRISSDIMTRSFTKEQ
jgi:hypothetical protein